MPRWRTGESWTVRKQERVLRDCSSTRGLTGLWGGKGDWGCHVGMEASKDDWAGNWGVRIDV